MLEPAVLVDVDGTLALRREGPDERQFFDWHRVGEDVPHTPVVELVRALADSMRFRIIIMSGRDEVCRPETEQWLDNHEVPWHELWMRPNRDNRKDLIVKRELYEQHIQGRYHVVFVVDDRKQVVSMWREELGLTVLQCAEGDF